MHWLSYKILHHFPCSLLCITLSCIAFSFMKYERAYTSQTAWLLTIWFAFFCCLFPLQAKYEKDASQFWDGFYETHQNKFFKDRRWLFQEFPELLPSRRRSDWPVDANADSNPAAEKEEEEGLCITRAATGQPDKEEVQPGKQEVLPSNRLRPGAGQSSDFPGELASFRILEVGVVITRSQGFWLLPLSEFRLKKNDVQFDGAWVGVYVRE